MADHDSKIRMLIILDDGKPCEVSARPVTIAGFEEFAFVMHARAPEETARNYKRYRVCEYWSSAFIGDGDNYGSAIARSTSNLAARTKPQIMAAIHTVASSRWHDYLTYLKGALQCAS